MQTIGRLPHHTLQNLMPPRNTLRQPLPQSHSEQRLGEVLLQILASVPGVLVREHGHTRPDAVDVLACASGNTWSRAARRKKRDAMGDEAEEAAQRVVQLVCRIRCERRGDSMELVSDWVSGRDRGLFESFTSHVQRKVVAAVAAEQTAR